jgi:hypothetical protein
MSQRVNSAWNAKPFKSSPNASAITTRKTSPTSQRSWQKSIACSISPSRSKSNTSSRTPQARTCSICPKWILTPSRRMFDQEPQEHRTRPPARQNQRPTASHAARQNKSRVDFAAKFEQLIADYNAGGKDIDTFFVEVISFARSLSEEEQRGISLRTYPKKNSPSSICSSAPISNSTRKNASRSNRSPKNCSTPSKPNASSSTGANSKRPAPPSAWRFSTRSSNCQSRTPTTYMTRSAKSFTSMCMRRIRVKLVHSKEALT